MSEVRNEMVNRVALAIAKASGINDWFKAADEFEEEARAAIEAMRIPGLILIEEAGYPAEYSDAWDYVLNEALSPSSEDEATPAQPRSVAPR